MDLQQKLEALVSEAIEILAPKFQITNEEKAIFRTPTLEVCDERSSYHLVDNHIKLNRSDLDRPYVVGEEISHYIHFQLKPSISNKAGTLLSVLPEVRNREMIGRYGALVYVASKGPAPDDWQKQGLSLDNGEDTLDILAHDFGYERAYRLFELHGDKYLARLARMDVDDAFVFARGVAPISWYERKILPLFPKPRILTLSA